MCLRFRYPRMRAVLDTAQAKELQRADMSMSALRENDGSKHAFLAKVARALSIPSPIHARRCCCGVPLSLLCSHTGLDVSIGASAAWLPLILPMRFPSAASLTMDPVLA
eukprot:6192626-Pleurochrysis_carterae.AAC.3